MILTNCNGHSIISHYQYPDLATWDLLVLLLLEGSQTFYFSLPFPDMFGLQNLQGIGNTDSVFPCLFYGIRISRKL